MADDNVTKFPKSKAVVPPSAPSPVEPDPKVVKLAEIALEHAKSGTIDFIAIVAMPIDGTDPIIAAAGKADPYRVIGALMRGAFTNLGAE